MQTPLVEVIKIVDGQELGLDRWIRFDAMRYGSDKLLLYGDDAMKGGAGCMGVGWQGMIYTLVEEGNMNIGTDRAEILKKRVCTATVGATFLLFPCRIVHSLC